MSNNESDYPLSHVTAIKIRQYLNGHGCPEIGEGADPGVKKIVEEAYESQSVALKTLLIHIMGYSMPFTDASHDEIVRIHDEGIGAAWLAGMRALGVKEGERL